MIETIGERFWKKVHKTETCWNWTAYTDRSGYGSFRFNNKIHKAHRISFLLANGYIDNNLDVLHGCDNPSCVNPEHLRLGTDKDNVQDTLNRKRHFQTNQTHCFRGHEFTKSNTKVNKKTNARCCRICFNMMRRLSRKRKKEENQ